MSHVTIAGTSATKNDFIVKFRFEKDKDGNQTKKTNPLPVEKQIELIDKILNNVFSVSIDGKKELLLSIGNGKVLHLDRTIKNFRTNLELVYRELNINSFETINLEKLFELLKSREKYSYRESFSLFHQQTRIVINREENEIINEIKIDYDFAGKNIDKKIYDEVVQGINTHWQGLIPLILDHIVAGRYVVDKKNIWLLIMADSNFGKSKLFKWMEKFGGSSFVDYKDLDNNGISDKDPKEFLGKLCLVIDEVLKFNRPMFKIEEHLMVRPMRNHSVKVPIGSRILLSADGGIFNSTFLEDQIKNRVAKIDLRSPNSQELGDIEVAKYGNYVIEKTMEYYIFLELTKRISEYEKLNEIDRANKAEKTIKDIFSKYKFQTINFFEKVEEIIYDIFENRDILDDFHRELLDSATIRVDNRNYQGYLIQRPSNVVPRILISYDNSLEYELKYKEIQQIASKIKSFSMPENGLKIDGKKYRGLFIADKKTKEIQVKTKKIPLVYETISKEAEDLF